MEILISSIRKASTKKLESLSADFCSVPPSGDLIRDLYGDLTLTALEIVHVVVGSDYSRLVDRRADIRLPGKRQTVRAKHMEKCRALGRKLATDLLVGVPWIIYVSSKANQHVESEVVIREQSCFTAVEVSPVVGGESILPGSGVRSDPVVTCSGIGAPAVFARPGICRSAVGGAHPESDNDTGRRDYHCKRLDDDSNGLCGHTVRVLAVLQCCWLRPVGAYELVVDVPWRLGKKTMAGQMNLTVELETTPELCKQWRLSPRVPHPHSLHARCLLESGGFRPVLHSRLR